MIDLIEVWALRRGRTLSLARTAQFVALVIFTGALLVSRPSIGPHGRPLVVVTTFPVAVAAAAAAIWLDRRGAQVRVRLPVLLLAGVSGTLLAIADPRSSAPAFPYLIAVMAGSALEPWPALGVIAAVTGTFAICVVAGFVPVGAVWTGAFVPFALVGGMNRRAHRQRLEQADKLVAQTERTRLAERESAALTERTRIAREIHDVLAHSIAALAVQLEAAEVLLENGRPERAAQSVATARRLAVDGMAETRSALTALRGEPAGPREPLPEALRDLAATVHADVRIAGEWRMLPAETTLTLYRAAQEALTNIVKHAPGATAGLYLEYGNREVTVTVHNDAPAGERPALADSGSGLGLLGMAERAERVGGTAEFGRHGDGWRVRVRVPA